MKIDKETIINKWGKSLSEESTMANLQNQTSANFTEELSKNCVFPIAKQVAAQTIGYDLVSVQPLSAPIGMGNTELLNQAKIKAKIENRSRRVKAILEDVEFKEFKLEETDEYKKYLKTGVLNYFDFKYENKTI